MATKNMSLTLELEASEINTVTSALTELASLTPHPISLLCKGIVHALNVSVNVRHNATHCRFLGSRLAGLKPSIEAAVSKPLTPAQSEKIESLAFLVTQISEFLESFQCKEEDSLPSKFWKWVKDLQSHDTKFNLFHQELSAYVADLSFSIVGTSGAPSTEAATAATLQKCWEESRANISNMLGTMRAQFARLDKQVQDTDIDVAELKEQEKRTSVKIDQITELVREVLDKCETASQNATTLLSSDVVIGEKIGSGSTTDVFNGVVRQKVSFDVAIKIARTDDASVAESLIDEGKLLLTLAHPNIIKTYAALMLRGKATIVLQLAKKSLSAAIFDEAIAAVTDSDVAFSAQATLRMLREICDGLVYLHTKRIVHGDLRPENILIDSANHVLISDFGLSRVTAAGADEEQADASNNARRLGDAHFTAPENLDKSNVWFGRKPSDVYSFGMLMWAIATRTLPFRGKTEMQILSAKTGSLATYDEEARPPMDFVGPRSVLHLLPEHVRALISDCIAQDPAQRDVIETVQFRLSDAGATFARTAQYRPQTSATVMALPSSNTALIPYLPNSHVVRLQIPITASNIKSEVLPHFLTMITRADKGDILPLGHEIFDIISRSSFVAKKFCCDPVWNGLLHLLEMSSVDAEIQMVNTVIETLAAYVDLGASLRENIVPLLMKKALAATLTSTVSTCVKALCGFVRRNKEAFQTRFIFTSIVTLLNQEKAFEDVIELCHLLVVDPFFVTAQEAAGDGKVEGGAENATASSVSGIGVALEAFGRNQFSVVAGKLLPRVTSIGTMHLLLNIIQQFFAFNPVEVISFRFVQSLLQRVIDDFGMGMIQCDMLDIVLVTIGSPTTLSAEEKRQVVLEAVKIMTRKQCAEHFLVRVEREIADRRPFLPIRAIAALLPVLHDRFRNDIGLHMRLFGLLNVTHHDEFDEKWASSIDDGFGNTLRNQIASVCCQVIVTCDSSDAVKMILNVLTSIWGDNLVAELHGRNVLAGCKQLLAEEMLARIAVCPECSLLELHVRAFLEMKQVIPELSRHSERLVRRLFARLSNVQGINEMVKNQIVDLLLQDFAQDKIWALAALVNLGAAAAIPVPHQSDLSDLSICRRIASTTSVETAYRRNTLQLLQDMKDKAIDEAAWRLALLELAESTARYGPAVTLLFDDDAALLCGLINVALTARFDMSKLLASAFQALSSLPTSTALQEAVGQYSTSQPLSEDAFIAILMIFPELMTDDFMDTFISPIAQKQTSVLAALDRFVVQARCCCGSGIKRLMLRPFALSAAATVFTKLARAAAVQIRSSARTDKSSCWIDEQLLQQMLRVMTTEKVSTGPVLKFLLQLSQDPAACKLLAVVPSVILLTQAKIPSDESQSDADVNGRTVCQVVIDDLLTLVNVILASNSGLAQSLSTSEQFVLQLSSIVELSFTPTDMVAKIVESLLVCDPPISILTHCRKMIATPSCRETFMKCVWRRVCIKCQTQCAAPTNDCTWLCPVPTCRGPTWQPDGTVPKCYMDGCSTKFGVFTRVHHCRDCGFVVCGDHSGGKNKRKARVCDLCAKTLLEWKPSTPFIPSMYRVLMSLDFQYFTLLQKERKLVKSEFAAVASYANQLWFHWLDHLLRPHVAEMHCAALEEHNLPLAEWLLEACQAASVRPLRVPTSRPGVLWWRVTKASDLTVSGSPFGAISIATTSIPHLDILSRRKTPDVLAHSAGCSVRWEDLNYTVNSVFPVHLAALLGYDELVAHIITSDPTAKVRLAENGGTLAEFAACGDHVNVLAMLLENKIDLDVPNDHGATPFHRAVMCKNMDACQFLYSAGCASARKILKTLPTDFGFSRLIPQQKSTTVVAGFPGGKGIVRRYPRSQLQDDVVLSSHAPPNKQHRITGNDLSQLFADEGSGKLQFIDLRRSKVTEADVAKILSRCYHLISLNLSMSTMLSESVLGYFLQHPCAPRVLIGSDTSISKRHIVEYCVELIGRHHDTLELWWNLASCMQALDKSLPVVSVLGVDHTINSCVLNALRCNPQHAPSWALLGHDLDSPSGGGKTAVTSFSDTVWSAESCFVHSLERDRRTAWVWHRLARVMKENVRVSGVLYTAIQCCVESLRHDALAAATWITLGRSLPNREVIVQVPFLEKGKKEFTKLECFVRSHELDDRSSEAWLCMGQVLALKNDTVFADGSAQTKIDCLLKSIALDATVAQAWEEMGRATEASAKIRILGHDYDKKDLFLESLRLDPAGAMAWCYLGLALSDQSIPKLRIDMYNKFFTPADCHVKSLECSEQNALPWRKLGYYLDRDERTETVNGKTYAATGCFLKSLEIDPHNDLTWVQLGSALGKGDRVDFGSKTYDKEDCFVRCLELNFDNETAWFKLGFLGCKFLGSKINGDTYRPKDCYVQQLRVTPRHSMAFSNLGHLMGHNDTIFVNGTKYSKRQCYCQALRIDPENVTAARNLEAWEAAEEERKRQAAAKY